ncbi:MAG TPA: PD-(D/E)XK nuclease family protein [Firmicutes bacterium]|nr:PD-(D/E)XK nuclease family protein [Bacillota bacterium]
MLLLVPEQFSFETERALLERLGPRLCGSVQVLSFTRLAEQVFRETGGLAGRRMDDAIRALLMSRALELTADHLVLYRKPAGDPETVQTVLAMTTELKQCGISPHRLEETAGQLPEGSTLRRKTEELALILHAFEAVASGVISPGTEESGTQTNGAHERGPAYIDPLDDLAALAERLPESRIADGAQIFVDSFKGFTAQETAVLRQLMRRAEQVTVTLCADSMEDTFGGFGLFSPVIRTAARLRDLAREDGVPVARIINLRENRRSSVLPLRLAEAGCFAPRPTVYAEETEAVTLASCAEIYTECDFVARSIRRALREQGGRARDFAVVARNLDEYRGVLDAAMEKQEIPLYFDERTNLLTEPLPALLFAALEAVTSGFRTDDLLRLMKTGLAGFSTHSVALLENYVLMWRIDGRRWREEWTGNPNGLSVKADDLSDKRLAYLNLLRRRLLRPLERLHASLFASGADGEAFARALYRYLIDVKADTLTRLRVARLERAGEPALADRMDRLWDTVMELLDRMAVSFRGTALPPLRFAGLLRMVAGLTDLGAVPQSMDAVQVGQADRIRLSAPKTVFVLGANEGVFPAYPASQGLLTEEERRELIARGLPLADGADIRTAEERFFAYAAVAAPSERLVVSYVRGNAGGESLTPSALVETLRRILPRCRVLTVTGGEPEGAESERDAFECAASLWNRPTPRAQTLRELFATRPEYARRLLALARAADRMPAAFREDGAARRFFGDDLRLSASRVEQYHRCRFAYFCKYGLRAEPRRPADLDALAFGTLTHYVMETVLPSYAKEGFDHIRKERAFTDAAQAVQAYAEETMGGLEDKTSRFAALLGRLSRVAGSLLWQVVRELRQSRFVPVDYELPVGLPDEEDGPAVPPVVLTLPDGAKVRVIGKIDRVDIYRAENGEQYVRIVDYKTGTKEFRLSDVVEGVNVQMLIYIFSLWQNGGERYGKVTPAGVLYLPAKLPVIQAPRDADGETAEREQLRALRMNGLLLDDPEIVRAMEHDAAGLFIPARLTAKGELVKGASVASLEQFGKLKKRIEDLLVKMAETLRRGDVAALPLAGEIDACAWCDYRAVCGHEPDDPVRFLAARDAASVLEELDGEAGGRPGPPPGNGRN